MDDKGKKLLIIALCIFITVIGIYKTFFNPVIETKNTSTNISKKEETGKNSSINSSTKKVNYDASKEPLPEEAVESSELYVNGAEPTVYFSNTEQLDASTMPLTAQAEITKDVQKYLSRNGYGSVTKLSIDNGSFTDTDEKIHFTCTMEGYEEKLSITYLKEKSEFQFSMQST